MPLESIMKKKDKSRFDMTGCDNYVESKHREQLNLHYLRVADVGTVTHTPLCAIPLTKFGCWVVICVNDVTRGSGERRHCRA